MATEGASTVPTGKPSASSIKAAAPERMLGAPAGRHFGWIDVRGLEGKRLSAVLVAAATHGLDGVVAEDLGALRNTDRSLRRVWIAPTGPPPEALSGVEVDVVLLRAEATDGPPALDGRVSGERGAFVDVHDAESLATACRAARTLPWTTISFADPTKIPLEIVLADGDNADGRTITVVRDSEEAEIVFDVLEHGSDGVMLAAATPREVAALGALFQEPTGTVELVELTVVGVEHLGAGDRACVDTCSLLHEDEGMLVGSFSNALLLNCSETHPLPYMPTRPFRVNAGALHSYVLASTDRTNYLSELRAGDNVIAVRTDGTARRVVVGRVKIERRPLLRIEAKGPGGEPVSVIVQDDWHVRVLGPQGVVHNVTELRSGDVLMGHLPPQSRHVGIPLSEFCVER